jgi:hypothetical protein
MASPSTSSIIIIDDEPDTATGTSTLIKTAEGIESDVYRPSEVNDKILKRSSLILVDYKLDNWPERDRIESVSLKPRDGVALAAVLRSCLKDSLRDTSGEPTPPTAVAVYSARLSELSVGMRPSRSNHVIARSLNLEWAFGKRSSSRVETDEDEAHNRKVARQAASLASSVNELPSKAEFMENDLDDLSTYLLDLDKKNDWFPSAYEDVEDCYPPVYEGSARSKGLGFLRWMLQRILPYPCFLWSSDYLAARLGVTPSSLSEALKAEDSLSQELSPYEYTGILSNFTDKRWWRAGIEDFLWDVTDGKSYNFEAIHSALNDISSSLELLPRKQHVVTVDEDYRPSEEVVGIEKAIEIQPDDWPPYSDQAWVTREQLEEASRLRGLVVSADQNKIQ